MKLSEIINKNQDLIMRDSQEVPEIKKLIAKHLNDLCKDYDNHLTDEESDWLVLRISQFLHKKDWATMDHFFKTCRHMVENALTYRKITVAIFKTAWVKVHEQE